MAADANDLLTLKQAALLLRLTEAEVLGKVLDDYLLFDPLAVESLMVARLHLREGAV